MKHFRWLLRFCNLKKTYALSILCALILLVFAAGVAPAASAPKGSTAILLTTHFSDHHLQFMSACWPTMLKSSRLLRNAAIYVYATNLDLSDSWLHALAQLPNYVSVATRANPGRQGGAIQASHDHSFLTSIDPNKYEWVIRMNPDVIIYNSSRLEALMQEPNVDAILGHCGSLIENWCGGMNSGCEHVRVQTDFTVLKTTLLHAISKQPIMSDNAERDMMLLLSNVTREHRDRWISRGNPSKLCRIHLEGEIVHTQNPAAGVCEPQEFQKDSDQK